MFSVGRDTAHLYGIDPTGARQRELGTFAGNGPVLSPNGKDVAYSAGKMPAMHLVLASRDGSGPRALTDTTTPAFNAAWSPDGRQIAYTTFTADHKVQVWVTRSDGSDNHRLMDADDAEGGPQWPAWSPDGKRLAVQVGKYVRERPAENTAHIWVIDMATGAKTKLAAHTRPYLDETPSWLPDGKRIAFQSDRTGRMEVWIMNADGTGAVQVTK